MTASWRAGLGLLLTSGIAGIGPDLVLFLGINLIGLYLCIVAVLFFLGEVSRWFKRTFRLSESKKVGR